MFKDYFTQAGTNRRALLAWIGAAALSGCQQLPIDGPLASDVRGELTLRQRVPFRLVRLYPDMVPILREGGPGPEHFITDLGPAAPRIGPGDKLVVTIVEPSAGGLFSALPNPAMPSAEAGARVVTLPEVTVDTDGRVSMPFTGPISVNGLTHVAAAERIRGALADQAITPQVIVSTAASGASGITVAGAVKTPGPLPLRYGGESILEAIARAGGVTDVPEALVVQLIRFAQPHRVRMGTLIDRPETNIQVRLGDYIHVLADPRRYMVLGATGRVNEERLTADRTTMAGALARAGGLLDYRADAQSVMLFRYETPEILDRIAAIDARLARARGEDVPIPDTPRRTAQDAPQPVVFVLNLRSASGFFMAEAIDVRDRDLIYAPNSEYTQWQKFLDIIRLTANPVASSATAARSF